MKSSIIFLFIGFSMICQAHFSSAKSAEEELFSYNGYDYSSDPLQDSNYYFFRDTTAASS